MTKEIRYLPIGKAEVREIGDEGAKKLVGYAAVFNSMSEDLGFREVIKPGSFKDSLAEAKIDVLGLFNHDDNLLLGRSSNGTVELREDQKGLLYQIDPPDTSTARDVVSLLKRGDLRASSFAFTVREGGESWHMEGDTVIRTLTGIDVWDVSVVSRPAYEATSASMRSLAMGAFENWQKRQGPDVAFLRRKLIAALW